MKSTCPPPFEDYDKFVPLEVEIKGFSFEEGLRRFRSLVQKSKVLALYKEKQSFEKPSEKKRRKRRESIEKRRLNELREKQMISGEWDKRQKKKDEKRSYRRRDTDE